MSLEPIAKLSLLSFSGFGVLMVQPAAEAEAEQQPTAEVEKPTTEAEEPATESDEQPTAKAEEQPATKAEAKTEGRPVA